MPIDLEKLATGVEISNLTFEREDSHLAHTTKGQGYSANNRPTALVLKAKNKLTQEDLDSITKNTDINEENNVSKDALSEVKKQFEDELSEVKKALGLVVEENKVLKDREEKRDLEVLVTKCKNLGVYQKGEDGDLDKLVKLANIVKSLAKEDGEFLLNTLSEVKKDADAALQEFSMEGYLSEDVPESDDTPLERNVQKATGATNDAIKRILNLTDA